MIQMKPGWRTLVSKDLSSSMSPKSLNHDGSVPIMTHELSVCSLKGLHSRNWVRRWRGFNICMGCLRDRTAFAIIIIICIFAMSNRRSLFFSARIFDPAWFLHAVETSLDHAILIRWAHSAISGYLYRWYRYVGAKAILVFVFTHFFL